MASLYREVVLKEKPVVAENGFIPLGALSKPNGGIAPAPKVEAPEDVATATALLDLSVRRRDEARTRHLARHDALTGLPNRSAFHETITFAIEDEAVPAFVLLMDLDRLRGMDFLAQAETLIQAKLPRLIWGDQCVLNALLADRARMIDPAWNATVPGNLRVFFGRGAVTRAWRRSLRRAALVHFTGGKPWRLHPRMRGGAWWRFALASPRISGISGTNKSRFQRTSLQWLCLDSRSHHRGIRAPRFCISRGQAGHAVLRRGREPGLPLGLDPGWRPKFRRLSRSNDAHFLGFYHQ